MEGIDQSALYTAIASVLVAMIGMIVALVNNGRVNGLKSSLKDANARIDRMEDALCSWKGYVGYLLSGIRKLTNQLRKEGFIPEWRPDRQPPEKVENDE